MPSLDIDRRMREIQIRAGSVLRIPVLYEGWPKPEFVWKHEDDVLVKQGRIQIDALAGKGSEGLGSKIRVQSAYLTIHVEPSVKSHIATDQNPIIIQFTHQ